MRAKWNRGASAMYFASIVLFSFMHVAPALAKTIDVIPSIALEETWDSNILNTSSDETSDYIFRARPRLDILFKSFQTTTKIGGGIQSEWYAEQTDLNSLTAIKNLDLTLGEPLQITPRFSLGLFGSFLESNDAVGRNELSLTPAPDVPASEAVVTERVKTREYRGFVKMTYLLTQRTDVSVGGGLTKRNFIGDTTGIETTGISLEDSTYVTGDGAIYYAITPRFAAGVFVAVSNNSFEVRPNSKTYATGAAGRYKLTPLHTLTARAGATYLKESGDAQGVETEKWFPYGTLALAYARKSFETTLRGSYELMGAGSFGEITKRASVSLAMSYLFTEKWLWDFSGYFQNNKSSIEPVTVDVNTFQGRTGIKYTATDWVAFYLKGTITRQRSKGTEGSDLDRESALLGVIFSKPNRPF